MASDSKQPAERLVDLASRLWRAMERALPQLPETTRYVLNMRLADSDVRWALALVLAGWRLSEAGEPGAAEIEALLREMGALPLSQKVASLQAVLPPGFGKFIQTARDATAEHSLAGAGAYLAAAVNELGEGPREVLHTWLREAPFRDAGRMLIRRFPAPGSGRPSLWGNPEPAPAPPKKSSAPLPRPPRGERFDRADFQTRTRIAQTTPRSAGQAEIPISARTPQPPQPVIERAELSRAYLLTLGWDAAEVDRLLAGPAKEGR